MNLGGGFKFGASATSADTTTQSTQSTQPAGGGFKLGGAAFGAATSTSAPHPAFGAPAVSTTPATGFTLPTQSSGTTAPTATAGGLFGSFSTTLSSTAPSSTAPAGGFQFGAKLDGRIGMPASTAPVTSGSTAALVATTSQQGGGLPSFQQAISSKQAAPTLQTTTAASTTQQPVAQPSLFASKTPAATTTTSAGSSNFLTQQPAAAKTPATSAAVATSAPTTATTSSTTSSNKPVKNMSYKELEEQMNKWYMELEGQEKKFLEQAMKVNAWDRDLIENGEKITDLNNQVENVKKDQSRLTSELDFITSQQKELEEMLIPLEQSVSKLPSINSQQHVDSEREHTYQMAENIDGQLKRMTEDLKELIDHLNTTSNSKQDVDPLMAVSKILNAHMDSLQWIEQNTVALQAKTQAIGSHAEVMKKEHERNLRLAYS